MLNIALAGLGTVGSGVARILQKNAELITARAGQPVKIKAVSALDRKKDRDCDMAGVQWIDDARKLAYLDGVDAVVEQIGGEEGVARELATAALKNNKHYITANKALLAKHGVELARLAEQNNLQLSFEASVCGGIPVIKTLREGLTGNRITSVRGIINGTCNYILTRMRTDRLGFDEALREAQRHGFAEANPAADVDGHDAAFKLALLSAVAFGIEPNLAAVRVEGIRDVTERDFEFAEKLECHVKLLGVARMGADGIEAHVGPAMVKLSSPLAHVEGALNAVVLNGDHAGDITLGGKGAGSGPTASAVVADIVDLARGHRTPAFGVPTAQLRTPKSIPPNKGEYYLRLHVVDKPGVMADIGAIMGKENVSMENVLQRKNQASETVPLMIVTDVIDDAAIHRAIDQLVRLPHVKQKPVLMRIEC